MFKYGIRLGLSGDVVIVRIYSLTLSTSEVSSWTLMSQMEVLSTLVVHPGIVGRLLVHYGQEVRIFTPVDFMGEYLKVIMRQRPNF